MATGSKKAGNCLKDCSAHDAAMSKRPANKCDSAMPACIRKIELHGLVEQRQCLIDCLPRTPMQMRHGAQIVIVGSEAAGRLPPGALNLRPLELGGDRSDDACRDLILKLEDIVEPPFESIGPKVSA